LDGKLLESLNFNFEGILASEVIGGGLIMKGLSLFVLLNNEFLSFVTYGGNKPEDPKVL
jgi:hypothetical protein